MKLIPRSQAHVGAIGSTDGLPAASFNLHNPRGRRRLVLLDKSGYIGTYNNPSGSPKLKAFHMPLVDGRYWLGITLASVFGTNLGDFYAHESGLDIGFGLLALVAVAAAVFATERFDRRGSELYYWLVIIIIRTGATNIADHLAYRVRIPSVLLSVGLLLILAVLAWWAKRTDRMPGVGVPAGRLPDTGAAYWSAMLTAGVFGTVFGDVCSHIAGQGVASIALGVVLLLVLWAGQKRAAYVTAFYWGTVAVARTAGTAMGDWLAENKMLHLGLPLSTLITGCTFAAVLLVWRSRRVGEALA